MPRIQRQSSSYTLGVWCHSASTLEHFAATWWEGVWRCWLWLLDNDSCLQVTRMQASSRRLILPRHAGINHHSNRGGHVAAWHNIYCHLYFFNFWSLNTKCESVFGEELFLYLNQYLDIIFGEEESKTLRITKRPFFCVTMYSIPLFEFVKFEKIRWVKLEVT